MPKQRSYYIAFNGVRSKYFSHADQARQWAEDTRPDGWDKSRCRYELVHRDPPHGSVVCANRALERELRITDALRDELKRRGIRNVNLYEYSDYAVWRAGEALYQHDRLDMTITTPNEAEAIAAAVVE